MTELISVVVVTYNFENFIIETLESIKNQTYPNIELIISDDCSTDNTIEKCKEWINKNGKRFNNVVILTSNYNEGPTKNYNKGLRIAKGVWVKYISDDIMSENFLTESYEIVKNNSEIEILFSISQVFLGNFKEKNFQELYPEKKMLKNYELTVEKQLESILDENFISAPTNFIKKSLLDEVGYCDEKYKFFEDYPLWIKILERGKKIYLNNSVNIYYRRHEKSVSYNGSNYINKKNIEFLREYFNKEQKYKFKNILKKKKKNIKIYRQEVIINSGNKGPTFYSRILRYLEISRYRKKKYILILLIFIIYLFVKKGGGVF